MTSFAPKSDPKPSPTKPAHRHNRSQTGLPAKEAASPAPAFVDNRPEAKRQRALQAMANNSPQVQRMAELQAMADRSPQVQQSMQLQAMIDNSPLVKAQAEFQAMINNSPHQVAQRQRMAGLVGATLQRQEGLDEDELLQGKSDPIQRQELEDEEPLQGRFAKGETPTQRQGSEDQGENRTGMPDPLKSGLEQLSRLDLSDVRVHYNSPKPADVNALAYAQGQDIHLGPGQEQHLPHEGWHTVQQKQGRVKPTMQARGVAINDDEGLEKEADVMGAKAAVRQASKSTGSAPNDFISKAVDVVQSLSDKDLKKIAGAKKTKKKLNDKFREHVEFKEKYINSGGGKSFDELFSDADDWDGFQKTINRLVKKYEKIIDPTESKEYESKDAVNNSPKSNTDSEKQPIDWFTKPEPKRNETNEIKKKKKKKKSTETFIVSTSDSPSVWLDDTPSEVKSGKGVPKVSNKLTIASTNSDIVEKLKNDIVKWHQDDHDGRPGEKLTVEQARVLRDWASELKSNSGIGKRYTIVFGPGTGKYSEKNQMKFVGNETVGEKKATFHISLSQDVYNKIAI